MPSRRRRNDLAHVRRGLWREGLPLRCCRRHQPILQAQPFPTLQNRNNRVVHRTGLYVGCMTAKTQRKKNGGGNTDFPMLGTNQGLCFQWLEMIFPLRSEVPLYSSSEAVVKNLQWFRFRRVGRKRLLVHAGREPFCSEKLHATFFSYFF